MGKEFSNVQIWGAFVIVILLTALLVVDLKPHREKEGRDTIWGRIPRQSFFNGLKDALGELFSKGL